MYLFSILALSAILHGLWNTSASNGRRRDKREEYLWWAIGGHVVVCISLFVILAGYDLIRYGDWFLLDEVIWSWQLAQCFTLSALCLCVYFLALRRGYQHAPVTLVYPIARSSPIVIAPLSALLFNVSFGSLGALGIALGVLSLCSLAFTTTEHELSEALPAAAVALICTAFYSLSDKIAVSYLPSFGTQIGYVTACYAIVWLVYSIVLHYEFLQRQSAVVFCNLLIL